MQLLFCNCEVCGGVRFLQLANSQTGLRVGLALSVSRYQVHPARPALLGTWKCFVGIPRPIFVVRRFPLLTSRQLPRTASSECRPLAVARLPRKGCHDAYPTLTQHDDDIASYCGAELPARGRTQPRTRWRCELPRWQSQNADRRRSRPRRRSTPPRGAHLSGTRAATDTLPTRGMHDPSSVQCLGLFVPIDKRVHGHSVLRMAIGPAEQVDVAAQKDEILVSR